ncbi:MAG TPA: hypothetical protein VHH34_12050 [Pseudonocardiaceae bacterium]|nr:hypothetical protein [Pseudonocardiaceae bacterium]
MSDHTTRIGFRLVLTHPMAPAMVFGAAAVALAAVMTAGGAGAAGWVLLPLAAGYAISGSV